MLRWFTAFGFLACVFGTAGCTELTLATIDQKMSNLSDADCHYTQLLLTGAYCQSRTVAEAPTKLYCFRSLGGVDCYDQADPYDINQSGRALQPIPLQTPGPKPLASAEGKDAHPPQPQTTTAAAATPEN